MFKSGTPSKHELGKQKRAEGMGNNGIIRREALSVQVLGATLYSRHICEERLHVVTVNVEGQMPSMQVDTGTCSDNCTWKCVQRKVELKVEKYEENVKKSWKKCELWTKSDCSKDVLRQENRCHRATTTYEGQRAALPIVVIKELEHELPVLLGWTWFNKLS